MQFQVVFLIAVGSCFALASADLKIAEKDIQKSVTEGRNNYHKALYTYNEIGSAIGRALTQWTSPVEKFTFLDAKSSDPPPINISAACLSSLMTIVAHVDFRNVSHNPEWIIRLLDAQAKPPSSILEGNINWFGGFHECMNLTVYQNASNPTPDTLTLRGQYCLVNIGIEEAGNASLAKPKVSELLQIPNTLRAGLCVPDTCSAEDVKNLVGIGLLALDDKIHLLPADVTVLEVKCPARQIPLDGPAITVIIVLVAFATIVLIATMYDVLVNGFFQPDDPLAIPVSNYTSLIPPESLDLSSGASFKEGGGLLAGICVSLSAVSNTRKIFRWGQVTRELRWIHGLRVLSMIWIILGQSYILGLPVFDNLAILPEAMKTLFTQIIVQATFAVDTFLFLSGFLVAHRFLHDLSGGFDCFRLIRFYVNRYLRLFPVYMVILGVYASLTKYISSGPVWPQDESVVGNCSHLVWTNAFYVNNYVQPGEMCMPWSFYIAIDFQLFVIAPFIVLALSTIWRAGVALCVMGVLIAVIAAGVISKVLGLPPGLVGFGSTDVSAFDQDLTVKFFTNYLITTYCRAAPYFIGILAAFFLRDPVNVRRPSFLAVVSGWILALLGIAIVVFGLVPGFNGFPLSVDAAAAFNSLSHVVWAGALAWIAYSCVTGAVKGADRVLGWTMWRPLSAISYSVYLIAPIVIAAYYLSREEAVRFSHWNTLVIFGGNLVISVALGFIVYIFIEAPVRSLVQLVWRRTVSRSYDIAAD